LSNEIKSSAEFSEDELDEAFSNTPEEENEPMDIDCPLEFEDEEDELPEEDAAVKFEDLGNAIRTVNRKDETTPQERESAGNTLLEIRQTDMFEQLVSVEPEKRQTVAELISRKTFNRKCVKAKYIYIFEN